MHLIVGSTNIKKLKNLYMKKLLFTTLILVMALSVKTFAQKKDSDTEFKPFKVNVSLGYAIPIGGTGSKAGVLFAIEPKYAVMQELSLGLRLEGAVTLSGVDLNSGTSNSSASAKAAASYLVTGDYYFSNNDFRPFLGAGIGIFTTASAQLSSSNPNLASGSKFGGMIRGGFEYGHGRLGIEYNFVGKTTVPPSSPGYNDGYDVKNSYIGIKLGVNIGGGRIKTKH